MISSFPLRLPAVAGWSACAACDSFVHPRTCLSLPGEQPLCCGGDGPDGWWRCAGAREAAAGRAPAVPQRLLFSCAGEVSASNGVCLGETCGGGRLVGVLHVLSGVKEEVSDTHVLCCSHSLCSEGDVSVPGPSYRIKTYILIVCLATIVLHPKVTSGGQNSE